MLWGANHVSRKQVLREHRRYNAGGRVELRKDAGLGQGHERVNERGKEVDEVRHARHDLHAALGVLGHELLLQTGGLVVQVSPCGHRHDGMQASAELDSVHDKVVELRDEFGVVFVVGGVGPGCVAAVGYCAPILGSDQLESTVDEVPEAIDLVSICSNVGFQVQDRALIQKNVIIRRNL